eukprot:185698_1
MNNNPKQYKCICGKYLTKVLDQSTVYKEGAYLAGFRIRCDVCKHVIPKDTPFWHCEEEANEHHPHGVDICELCIRGGSLQAPNEALLKKDSKVKPLTNPQNTTTPEKPHNEKKSIIDLRNEVKTICILNTNTTESTTTCDQLISNRPSDQNYIISDVDAELLILVEFKQTVDLRTIKLFALQNTDNDVENKDSDSDNDSSVPSPPKLVHIYKTEHNNLQFEDMESMTPDVSITCSVDALHKGKTINLAKIRKRKTSLKFKKIRFVTIFIRSNQNDTEATYINGVTFKGQPSDHEKHKILIQEETLATTTLNQSANKSRWQTTEQTEQKQIEIKHGHFAGHGTVEKQSENNPTKYLEPFNPWASKTSIGHAINKFTGVECTASPCDHLSHIVDVLKQYHHFIECNVQAPVSTNISVDINNILASDSHVTLVNDFHHLIQKHRANFEQIYDTLIKANNGKECDIKLCVPLRRNHRNRHRLCIETVEINKLYFNHDNVIEISLQQILDKIHCYYFHSFDIGYKHTRQDRHDIFARAQKHELKSDDDDYV